MPTFSVKAPDGREFDLEGDSAPTEQELEEIYASLPTPKVASPATQDFERFKTEALAKEDRSIPKRITDEVIAKPVNLIKGLASTVVEGVKGAGDVAQEASKTPGLAGVIPFAKNMGQSAIEAGTRVAYDVGNLIRNKVTQNPSGALNLLTPQGLLTLPGKVAIDILKKKDLSEGDLERMYEESLTEKAYERDPKINIAPKIVGEANPALSEALPLALGAEGAIKGGINLATKGVSKVGGLGKLVKESAVNDVKQALLAGGGSNKEKLLASRLTPQILERPSKDTYKLTRQGMQEKASAGRKAAGEAIDEFGKLEGEAKLKPILDSLENIKTEQRHVVAGKVLNPDIVNHIDQVKDIISQYGDSVSMETLRDIRKGLDQATYGVKGSVPTISEGSIMKFKKLASDEAREILSQADPDLAKLNAQYNFFSNLEEVMQGTNKRLGGKSGGLAPLIAGVAGGAASGGTMTAMAVKAYVIREVYKAVRSPGWKLTSARVKNNIAKALGSGNPQALSEALNQVDGFKAGGSALLQGIRSKNEEDEESPQITIPPRSP